MHYDFVAIDASAVPRAADPLFQHVVDTYVSEANKLVSLWRAVPDKRLEFRPDTKVNDIRTILKHQLLSERRFFAQFIGTTEPDVATLLPEGETPPVAAFIAKYLDQVNPRLPQIAAASCGWWMQEVPFFGSPRQRIWTFWRRVLHTAHHRTQLTLYLRMLDRPVPSTYGPTADVTWSGADPTLTVEAAGR